MSVLVPPAPRADSTENWDEDFEFSRPTSSATPNLDDVQHDSRSRIQPDPRPRVPPKDPSTPLSKPPKSILNTWAEPGPSTPLKRIQHTENWDDDFQDADSPRPSARRSSQSQSQSQSQAPPNGAQRSPPGSASPVENWDEDFEEHARTGASPRRRTPRKRTSWGSSDDEDESAFADREDDRTVTTRSRGVPFHIPIDAPPPVPPLPSPFPRSPTASVFSVPVSSTGRESSAGYSYSSHAHLPLRPTVSGGNSAAVAARLALLPPSPPIHRERRRLRKKSRPPHNFEEGIFELDDRTEFQEPSRPSTPDNSKRPRDPPATSLDDPLPEVGHTSTGKTPLLSRIGSVGKKWGAARRKRASTGPAEVALRERDEQSRDRDRYPESEGSRPTSFIASSSPGHGSGPKSWFFRGGGGGQGPGSPPQDAPLKHERSVERLLHLMGVDRDRDRDSGSPSPRKRKSRGGAHGREATDSTLPKDLEEAVDGSSVPTSTLLFGGTPRRPTSMHVSVAATASSSGSSWSTRPPVPRHVSYNDGRNRRPATPSSRASSKHRSASASVEDVHRAKKSSTTTRETFDGQSSDAHSIPPPEKPPVDAEKGGRRFMGGMRRISLVGGKNKRRKSVAQDDAPKVKRPGTASSTHEEAEKVKRPDTSTSIRDDTDTTHDNTTPRPPSRVVRSSHDAPLLPPIELQPPSPPRPAGERRPPRLRPITPPRTSLEHTLEPSRSHASLASRSTQAPSSATTLPTIPSPLPSPTRPKPSMSPVQTASLGRTAQVPKERDVPSSTAVPRRNSLGDLKIPARISQAQVGLKRDLSMVRDFATSVEQLKQLQSAYATLASQIRTIMHDPHESHSRPVSPSFVHFPKPSTRSRAHTNPAANHPPSRSQINAAFLNIEAKYRLAWECAELLIDLGGGAPKEEPTPTSPPPSSSHSVPVVHTVPDGRKSRERAITLAGDEQKPAIDPLAHGASPPLASPPPSQWRASTGRHDLSYRQLLLLREMLNNPDPSATMSLEPGIPEEEVNRNWRWGDAMHSTITLPSEESGPPGSQPSPTKKQRTSRLGMRGLRDMLKSLKKSYTQHPPIPPSMSSISASTDSSLNLPRESHTLSIMQVRRTRSSTGPESMASTSRRREIHPNSPYGTTPALSHKSSPRRPSLASIFRLGQKSKPTTAGQSVDDLANQAGLPSSSSGHASRSGTSLADEDEWHRVECASELDHAARSLGISGDGTVTVRGKKGRSPYLFQRPLPVDPDGIPRAPDGSQSSLWSPMGESPQKPSAIPPSVLQSYTRSIKLSDVREVDSDAGDGTHRPRSAASQSQSHTTRTRQAAPSPGPSSRRPPSRGRKNPTGSVRSAPPQAIGMGTGTGTPSPNLASGPLPDVKLAMAPENIKPLLENAREVHTRCSDCIAELEALLGSSAGIVV
ncbi:hypothetical protein GSI_03500 [Ganoderma sinense ZZ0214-1]|uniref:Uncharacterized protein n=1 Tax=Ganoderma sinense ZZ0214-1 TaxID=1077348 RepID=A0A2G8SLU4_9APHY|nr:hypothetical protein GSI_03500 [Ganoderma sinense ZZ0214-1]